MSTNLIKRVSKTVKQADAVRLISGFTTVLLEGGGRSGKTFLACYVILVRCMKYPGTRHLITRFRFAHAKTAICFDTMPKVLEACGLTKEFHLNKTDWFYENKDGSTIWIGGLDDKDRTEKILGNEYDTIFMNEASQISYSSYEMLVTRLNPHKGVKGKMIIDYNPPSILHWGYTMFHKRKFPDGRDVPKTDFKQIKMNPGDNKENISPEYLKNLENLSMAKRKRFLHGEYSLDAGKLWKRAWIHYFTGALPDFERLVVAVDPTGSLGGDEAGIIVAGKYIDYLDNKTIKYIVLEDYSLHGTPSQWAEEAVSAYHKWEADCMVAEKNFGGDMVASTILNADDNVNVKLINSSRGKIVRAEPISALYERDKVSHRTVFMELEDELCTFDPEISDSPNRMDAVVFAITELFTEVEDFGMAFYKG